jgi:pimeloyl-ACP methyl ester carboxylesterase
MKLLADRGASLLLSLLLVTACTSDALSRREAATALAVGAGLQPVTFDAGPFVLAGDLKGAGSGQPVLVVYIEGDGLAFVSRTQRSRDPTPRHPVGLELAVADPSPAVLYLGRPCQYVTPSEERGCGPQYWSNDRFAPEVIEAVNHAIDQARVRVGAGRVVLIGYSGGGAVAALAAARRSDVAAWATVAAPLDHAAWTRWHDVSPLDGSLNPVDEAARLAGLAQIHFVGAADDVVPAAIVRGFLEREGPDLANRLVVLPGVDHYCCWAERWPDLRPLIPSGALPPKTVADPTKG